MKSRKPKRNKSANLKAIQSTRKVKTNEKIQIIESKKVEEVPRINYYTASFIAIGILFILSYIFFSITFSSNQMNLIIFGDSDAKIQIANFKIDELNTNIFINCYALSGNYSIIRYGIYCRIESDSNNLSNLKVYYKINLKTPIKNNVTISDNIEISETPLNLVFFETNDIGTYLFDTPDVRVYHNNNIYEYISNVKYLFSTYTYEQYTEERNKEINRKLTALGLFLAIIISLFAIPSGFKSLHELRKEYENKK